MSSPANWPADRPWPPRRATPSLAAAGAIEVVGQLTHDAELRMGTHGGRGVLVFELETGKGFPYEVIRPVPCTPHDLQAATTLQRALRRGVSVRVCAQGCLPRIDHGNAVLQLLEVTNVVPI